MAHPFYDQYIRSDLWKQIRERILARDGGKCCRCQSTDHVTVHHLTYDRLGHEWDSDLETLCGRCHFKEHFHNPKWKKKPTRLPPGLRLGKEERQDARRLLILAAVDRGEHPSSPWPRYVHKVNPPFSKRQRRESKDQQKYQEVMLTASERKRRGHVARKIRKGRRR